MLMAFFCFQNARETRVNSPVACESKGKQISTKADRHKSADVSRRLANYKIPVGKAEI